MSRGIFNSSIFNKPIFNTKFIATPGFSHRGALIKKQKLLAKTFIKISSDFIIPVVIYSESKTSTRIESKAGSRISFNSFKETTSKILRELYQPVNSVISRDYSIPIKGRLNPMEISMNRAAKYSKIQGILALLDKLETGNNTLQDDDDITVTYD